MKVLRLATDENFNGAIVRGLLLRKPHLDLVRIQDTSISGSDDPTVLMWTAQNGRVLLTHDVSTMTRYAYERIETGKTMTGLIEVSRNVLIGPAIEDILLLVECSLEEELMNRIIYLPL